MNGVEGAVLRLATTVVSAIAKSLLEKWRTERQPRKLTDKETGRLVDKLVGRLGEAAGSAADHERAAAVAAVADAFAAAGPLDPELLLTLDLEPGALRAHVLGQAPAVRVGAALGDAGEALFDRLLDLCCEHIVAYVTALPEFPARSQVELVRRAGRTGEALDDVRRRLGPGPERAAAAFESRYTDFVRATHSRLQLFGVTLGSTEAEWALDTAYISLGVSGGGAELADRMDHAAFGGIAPDEGVAPGPVRIDHALAGCSRLLLRGPAGSGKSTLVQWLATNAARRSFGPELADWNVCVPFVLRLRALTAREALPLPHEFLSSMGNPLAGAAPAGWVEGLMASGRALVLVDGVDEVPQRLRKRTEDWLRQLVTAFPDARYVVTTRPSAVTENWLAAQSFRAHSLLPMSREDVRSFIRHWHEAARQEAARTGRAESLDTYEAAMLQAVSTRRELSRLSTNPLMCALLCALNRDRRMHLPRARKDLYDAALELLLVRRDTERDICAVEGVELTRDEQTLLLQELAYWLIRNDQVQADRAEAVEMVDGALAAMPQVRAQGDAEQVFRHLLIRSGLLREPTPGTVDFVHRTFQDYLAAKAAVEARDFGLLVSKAHDDQWEDVVRMAVGHARPEERVRLLRGILRRADRVKRARNRLNLLAAACLEQAPQLDPAVREEVEERMARLIPPWNRQEAEELARAGELVLDLLPGPEAELEDVCAAFVVHTAGLIGGPAAMAFIARFAADERGMVAYQVGDAWGHFNTDEYVSTVLTHAAGLHRMHLRVDSAEKLAALPRLPQVAQVTVAGDLVPFGRLSNHTKALWLKDTQSADLSPIRKLPDLQHLGLFNCPNVSDLSPLAGRSLDTLQLMDMRQGLSLAPLGDLPLLNTLNLSFPLGLTSLESLPVGEQLIRLILGWHASATHLHGIERWPQMKHVSLSGATLCDELHLLSALPKLEFLQLIQPSTLNLERVTALQQLKTLWLTECEPANGLAALGQLPALEELGLFRCTAPGPIDLAPLRELPGLTIRLSNTPVRNEHLFPPERIIRPGQRPAGT
ncbi:NACHT domain-containing NTPase [Streptomyces sp. XD-27]|uniref:NACHT domain-containing protein n=1 Tax=Streptomyces sp. XD-27 TaxID=3062779 RepID=UPI0026F46D10|nr:NACHT domain-containing protein [Streptomyces sp. XD-27]WKX69657.1 NACHT domain-containing protein [Streptomyces sp. XD-27]